MRVQIGFKQLGLGKHLQLTDVGGQHEYYASKSSALNDRSTDCDLLLVKHVLNPLGLAKYEIRQNGKVVADVK